MDYLDLFCSASININNLVLQITYVYLMKVIIIKGVVYDLAGRGVGRRGFIEVVGWRNKKCTETLVLILL